MLRKLQNTINFVGTVRPPLFTNRDRSSILFTLSFQLLVEVQCHVVVTILDLSQTKQYQATRKFLRWHGESRIISGTHPHPPPTVSPSQTSKWTSPVFRRRDDLTTRRHETRKRRHTGFTTRKCFPVVPRKSPIEPYH